MVAYAFCTLNKQWFLAPDPLTLILAFHYRTLIAAWQSSNVSDERNFFPDTSPHDKLTDEVISCKQKAAKSSVAVPIFSSTSGFRVVVCCACKHLHWRLAWFFLADRDNSRDFCFTAEHYGAEWRHHLPLTNKVVIQPFNESTGNFQLAEISAIFAVGFSRVRTALARTLGLLLCSITGVPNPHIKDCHSLMFLATPVFFLDKLSSSLW